MARFYFLATIVVLFVALAMACGNSGSSGGGGAADDDDDAAQADDDDNDDDNDDNDDDASTGCNSADYEQCFQNAVATQSSCIKKCPIAPVCQLFDCIAHCALALDVAWIACDAEYGCDEELTHFQCEKTCDQAEIDCLEPLILCTDTKAEKCYDVSWTACNTNCS